MASKFFLLLALTITQIYAQDLKTVDGKIKVRIGTMSGCPFAAAFITNQLVDVHQRYGKFLDINFVPWGRTTYDHENGFICRFGPTDCFANRLQRCALNMLKGDQDRIVEYMACEFADPLPSYRLTSYQCAAKVGLNLIEVDYCVSHPGDDLDWQAQEAAVEPMQVINGIPYIVFNDEVNIPLHREASGGRFRSMICFALAADPNSGITSCTI